MAAAFTLQPCPIVQTLHSCLTRRAVLSLRSRPTYSRNGHTLSIPVFNRLYKLQKRATWLKHRSICSTTGCSSIGSSPVAFNHTMSSNNKPSQYINSSAPEEAMSQLSGNISSFSPPGGEVLHSSSLTQLLNSSDSRIRSGKILNHEPHHVLSSQNHVPSILFSSPSQYSRAYHSHHHHLFQSTSVDHIVPQFSNHQSRHFIHYLRSTPNHVLTKMKHGFQNSHQSFGKSFSTASWIVESSPKAFQPYLRLIRMDKPIGTWLLYWPCTWSIALAAPPGTLPDAYLLALFGAGAFFMRGSGCIINDMWDKDFDEKVERTKTRPLANGDLTHFQALVFLGSQLSCALAILLQLNLYSVLLGAASMGLVVTYPLAKRYTYWPQFILGLTFNYGVLLGYSAVAGSVNWGVCLPMYVASVLWTLVYDTVYAHQDKHDDLLIGVKSAAIRLGEQTKPVLAAFTGAMAAGLVISGQMSDMTWPYYLAVMLTTGRLAQQVYKTDMDVADECAHAFRGNFYLGAIMFVGITLSNYLKQNSDEEVEDKRKVEGGENGFVSEEGKDLISVVSKEHVVETDKKDKKDTILFMPR